MLGIGQLECVSYGVVCGLFYCADNEKVLISEDNRQEQELCVQLCRLVIETHLRHFLNVFFLNLCPLLELFYAFYVSIYRTTNLMSYGLG